ncbi:Zn(II)2Cys6 transcription factor domain-containing protein [Aspergillus affinis]|uniref:Zn(II)2Cys6 transcription factor domain-containing protein n=1 Tax=Aspergillus affinis TaxID=1070780 RepID=UPI0022FDED18|nr:uncharacterized protein KD926_010355 [Aspergillus affinis]KAI9045032.1 hypothetical protein KD926_010355 [Aspergillus affinis]
MSVAQGPESIRSDLQSGKDEIEMKKSPSDEQTLDMDFRCEICKKSYTRPDLRDRHRRRCIAKVGQERRSKRKSCDSCAKKKIRCSLSRPSCLRCAQLGILCQYPQSPVSARIAGQGESMMTTSQPQPAELGETNEPSGAVGMMDVLPTTAHAQSQDLQAGHLKVFSAPMLGSGDPLSASMWNDYDFSDMQFIDPALTEDFLSSTNATGIASLPSNDAIPALSDFRSAESNFLSNVGSLHSGPLSSAHPMSDGRSNSGYASAIQQNEFISEEEGTSPSGLTGPLETFSPSNISWHDNSTDGESSMSAKLTSRLYSPAHLIFAHSFTIGMGPDICTDPTSLCQDMLGHLREYPGLVLDREFWSPFVHHRLYRCSLGGMAEPMANALACVGAYASCAGSSFGFVNRMINEEREKLVRKFHGYTDTPEPCLAALHAVCIYQIMGLFGDTFVPAAQKKPLADVEDEDRRRGEFEKEAELHSSFLLKMTRHLSSLHAKTLYVHHEDENDWNQWKFMESLRRNMFFVHIINILESKARQLNENYFEPLGDDLIFGIPLPAPERMWRACSSEEWFMARAETLGSEDDPTTRPRTLQQLRQAVKRRQVDMSSLLPVTRMILASVIIVPPRSGL